MKFSNLRTTYQGVKHAGLILLTCAASASASASPNSEKEVGDGCEVMTTQDQMNGLMADATDFSNPPEYDFTGSNKNAKPHKCANLKRDYPVGDGNSEFEPNSECADLDVEYKQPVLAGCKTNLRQWAGLRYNDRPVGPTMRIRPGQTYRALITNKLQEQDAEHHMSGAGHGGESTFLGYIPPAGADKDLNKPHNFNVTNLHTHGWRVDPTGESDNIFRLMEPGSDNRQIVHLPSDHPSGTFWYHSHVHGSTALQVASGMAGALIVKDDTKGLDAIPAIRDVAADRIMVFQQLAYREDGQVGEDEHEPDVYKNLEQKGYAALNRPVFVNGQAYPKIPIKAGELQRWRFIHAGITNGINPQLVRVNKTTGEVQEVINMHEISLDGLPTGTMPEIPYAVLAPAYRTDVLVQILQTEKDSLKDGEAFWLIDKGQAIQKDPKDPNTRNFRRVLAQIDVQSGTEVAPLPKLADIEDAYLDYQQGDPYNNEAPLQPLTPEELAKGKLQRVHYLISSQYQCSEYGGNCTPCKAEDGTLKNCDEKNPERFYMICDGRDKNGHWNCMNFNSSKSFARLFSINSANEWKISAESQPDKTAGRVDKDNNPAGGLTGGHIFHIHVNPFQVQRKYAYGTGYDFAAAGMDENAWVWKDTLVAPVYRDDEKDAKEIATIRTRYTQFTGSFVQHCHVLDHEDNGMMQVVTIEPTLEYLKTSKKENLQKLYEAIMEYGGIK